MFPLFSMLACPYLLIFFFFFLVKSYGFSCVISRLRGVLSPVTGKGFRWDLLLLGVDIDEGLHGLELLV